MQGGLALIATQTQGQAEAVAAAECGQLVPPHDTAALTDAIAVLLRDPEQRRREQRAALHAAQHKLCWERMEARVIAAADAALSALSPTSG